MLYVSRFVTVGDNEHIGVVDTDDGREDIVTIEELDYSVTYLGIEVEGADAVFDMEDNDFVVDSVIPIQPPETLSKAQKKFKTLTNIDIVKYNGVITAIRVGEKAPFAQRIKLSSFGTKCEDWILMTKPGEFTYTFIVVLDDKIDFGPNTFRTSTRSPGFPPAPLDIVFDIKSLTDQRRVDIIYETVIHRKIAKDGSVTGKIIDSEERYLQERRKWVK